MKITERKCKQIVGGAAAAALLLSGVHLPGAAWKEVKADTVSVNAKITKETVCVIRWKFYGSCIFDAGSL